MKEADQLQRSKARASSKKKEARKKASKRQKIQGGDHTNMGSENGQKESEAGTNKVKGSEL